jgi:hypothetical protein
MLYSLEDITYFPETLKETPVSEKERKQKIKKSEKENYFQ